MAEQASDSIVVKFIQRVAPYQPGEVASFNRPTAEGFVKRGLAEFFRPVEASAKTGASGSAGAGSAAKSQTPGSVAGGAGH